MSRAVLMNKNILTSCLNVSKDLISTYFPSDFNRLGYVWGKLIFKIAFQLILRELSLTNQYDGKSDICFKTLGRSQAPVILSPLLLNNVYYCKILFSG